MTRLSSNPIDVDRRRELFVSCYAVSGNGEAAAIAAGYAPGSSSRQVAARYLSDPAVSVRAREAREAYLKGQAAAYEAQAQRLRTAADTAIDSLLRVLETSKSHQAVVNAALGILDRSGHKPVDVTYTRIDAQAVVAEIDPQQKLEALRAAVLSITGKVGGNA